jgi:hypothetical protein
MIEKGGRRPMIRTHGRWGDEEALNDPAHREADELGSHHEEPLITKGPVLAIKLSLYGNDVGLRTVCQRGGDNRRSQMTTVRTKTHRVSA